MLYLPLSIIGAAALSRMDQGNTRMKASFLLVLIAIGSASMGIVLYSYAGAWGLPQEDYNAITWLSDQNFSDAVCINLDETGAWIYPMTGIKTARPQMVPIGFGNALAEGIARDPGDAANLDELRRIGHQNVLIYLSSVSITHPEYVPPFAEYLEKYPKLNLSFPEASYELLYDRGARIYRVRR